MLWMHNTPRPCLICDGDTIFICAFLFTYTCKLHAQYLQSMQYIVNTNFHFRMCACGLKHLPVQRGGIPTKTIKSPSFSSTISTAYHDLASHAYRYSKRHLFHFKMLRVFREASETPKNSQWKCNQLAWSDIAFPPVLPDRRPAKATSFQFSIANDGPSPTNIKKKDTVRVKTLQKLYEVDTDKSNFGWLA